MNGLDLSELAGWLSLHCSLYSLAHFSYTASTYSFSLLVFFHMLMDTSPIIVHYLSTLTRTSVHHLTQPKQVCRPASRWRGCSLRCHRSRQGRHRRLFWPSQSCSLGEICQTHYRPGVLIRLSRCNSCVLTVLDCMSRLRMNNLKLSSRKKLHSHRSLSLSLLGYPRATIPRTTMWGGTFDVSFKFNLLHTNHYK